MPQAAWASLTPMRPNYESSSGADTPKIDKSIHQNLPDGRDERESGQGQLGVVGVNEA